MHGREVAGRVLSFGHEGVLYRNSFIMYDHATDSRWLHVTGEALKGPLKGTQLPFLPSVVVPWAEWRMRHPQTRVLLGERAGEFMGGYHLRERPGLYGISLGEGREVLLVRVPLLRRMPVLHTTLGERSVVVCYDAPAGAATAFVAATLEGRALHFDAVLADPDEDSAAGDKPEILWLRDSETGSLWDPDTGACRRGALSGAALERLPATPWLVERWRGFFPDGRVLGLPEADADAGEEPERRR